MSPLQRDIIAGHESAIDIYNKVIGDLMLLNQIKLVDDLINHYLKEVEALRTELMEIKRKC